MKRFTKKMVVMMLATLMMICMAACSGPTGEQKGYFDAQEKTLSYTNYDIEFTIAADYKDKDGNQTSSADTTHTTRLKSADEGNVRSSNETIAAGLSSIVTDSYLIDGYIYSEFLGQNVKTEYKDGNFYELKNVEIPTDAIGEDFQVTTEGEQTVYTFSLAEGKMDFLYATFDGQIEEENQKITKASVTAVEGSDGELDSMKIEATVEGFEEEQDEEEIEEGVEPVIGDSGTATFQVDFNYLGGYVKIEQPDSLSSYQDMGSLFG